MTGVNYRREGGREGRFLAAQGRPRPVRRRRRPGREPGMDASVRSFRVIGVCFLAGSMHLAVRSSVPPFADKSLGGWLGERPAHNNNGTRIWRPNWSTLIVSSHRAKKCYLDQEVPRDTAGQNICNFVSGSSGIFVRSGVFFPPYSSCSSYFLAKKWGGFSQKCF